MLETENAIQISGLEKHYPGFSLGPLELILPSGCILGLVGENGAGKSTTIKLMMNAIHRDGGQIRILGIDNQSPDFDLLKNDIGVVLDEAYFPEVLNAKHVGAVMSRTYARWDAACYSRYLEHFRLPEKKDFKDYSRGMKMKLSIAVALSHSPRLLLLDEATSGLDPMVRDEILELFNEFTRDAGHSVLLSSHIVSDLEKVCDYIAFLHNGKLLLCEEKDRLLEEYALLRLSEAELAALPPEAVVSRRQGSYGVEALVLRSQVNSAFQPEHTSLEDIILFLAKGGDRK